MLHKNIFAELFPHIAEKQQAAMMLGGGVALSADGDQGGGSIQHPAQTGTPMLPNIQTQQAPGVEQPMASPPPQNLPAWQNPNGMPTNSAVVNSGMEPYRTAEGPPSLPDADIPITYKPEPSDAVGGLEYWREMQRNPVNQDKGWKGLVKEIAENFLFGMSKTQPGMGWKEALALGGTGAGAGFFNKGWNEQRRAEQEIPRAQQRVQFENAQRQEQAQTDNYNNQITNRNMQTVLDMDEATQKRISAAQKKYLDQWERLEEFDPSDPKYKGFAEEAERAGVTLIPKTKGQKFSAQIAPDGRVVVTNTSTGDYKIGQENLAKPPAITDKDLPDEMFGLYDDKEISDRASASIGKLPEGRRLRSDIANALPAEYKNSDGSINEQKALQDAGREFSPLEHYKLSDLYENLPSDYEQKVAGARTGLRDSQKALRTEVAKFRSAIGNYRPNANAAPVPISRLTDLFNKIMVLPSKERTAKLQEFYSNLPNIRIQ